MDTVTGVGRVVLVLDLWVSTDGRGSEASSVEAAIDWETEGGCDGMLR